MLYSLYFKLLAILLLSTGETDLVTWIQGQEPNKVVTADCFVTHTTWIVSSIRWTTWKTKLTTRWKDYWMNAPEIHCSLSLCSLLENLCACYSSFLLGNRRNLFLVFLCYSLTQLFKQFWYLGKSQVILEFSCSKSIK